MADCRGKSESLGIDVPVAYLTCNGSPPVGDKPSLMTFREGKATTDHLGAGYLLLLMILSQSRHCFTKLATGKLRKISVSSSHVTSFLTSRHLVLGRLQHMLTRATVGDVAGINGVEWDAVELPSQFMENWCYDRPTVYGFAKHYETGEPLPAEMFDKLKKQKTFGGESETRAGGGMRL